MPRLKIKPEDQYVMKLEGGVQGMERHPELLAHVGRFVMDYKPELAPQGKQWIWTTDNPAEALGFNSMEDLHALYRTAVGVRPWDGQPDRPITAYHVNVSTRKNFAEDGIHGWKPPVLEGEE